ncbi:CapA family protein [Oceanobacillus alkalisoli]|uniref:CapA family protein n=1 Tax=Oceanobacillus alkalisoli TaxID=2925113 RepID=UPI001EE3D27E|nr:CapA family protein [Oceanobacillus alkalisoli]MCG5104811.1 CapA family protein [Oceanobacillus alkalisoli]
MRIKDCMIAGLFMCLFSLLAACNMTVKVTSSGQELTGMERLVTLKETIPDVIIEEITISSIGDVLLHEPVYVDAWTGSKFNFSPMLEKVKPFLSEATITTANQESMIGGAELGLSTYPAFNSPKEAGDALKDAGVDVVMLANNHTLDRGEAAIEQAISHWDRLDMMYVGSYKNEADREKVRVVETDEGISAAFLNYTYGTNGIPVPEGKPYLVNLIDKKQMKEDIAEAKRKADLIVLNLHFGNEYERMPNEEQKDLVQFAADQGVHAVIGHHPHVLQPAAWVEGEDGSETLVIYSLGNFLSNQQELYQRIGGVFTFTVTKTTEGEKESVEIHSPTLLPTYVTFHPDWEDYQVVPMYTLTNKELKDAAQHYAEIKEHMSKWLPELRYIEE